VATVPLLGALAVARLLLLALPPALAGSPLLLVHGFHQLVLACVGVLLLALWREPQAPWRWLRAVGRAGAALGVAAVIALLFGGALTSAVLAAAQAIAPEAPHTLTELAAPGDVQGAIAFLPTFQAGLLLAIGMTAFPGWRRFLAAFALLLASQILFFVLLGELRDHAGLIAHALLVRAWAVGVPAVHALVMLRGGEPKAPTLTLRPVADAAR